MITNEIVSRAISYIMEHIGEEITIEEVADYCHFSKFYFSRIFKEETGESMYAFIKRMKLDQSAFRLKVERGRKITDIGFDFGYSPSNYSSAFKKYHNTSPVQFRSSIARNSCTHPFFEKEPVQIETYEECSKKISVEYLEDFFVLYERRIGNYYHLGQDWTDFMEKYDGFITPETIFIERTFDDPSITSADSCLYDICMTIGKDCNLPNTCTIQGGKFAVYHFAGQARQIYSAYQSLFNVWYPHNHCEVDERYGFDIYREIDCDTGHMVLDICMPIK